MGHDRPTDRDAVQGRLLFGGRWGSVRLPTTGRVASGVDAMEPKSDRGRGEIDTTARFWSDRKLELQTNAMLRDFECNTHTSFGVSVVIARLQAALDLEVSRRPSAQGSGAHWAYDVSRARNLRHLLARERKLLEQLDRVTT